MEEIVKWLIINWNEETRRYDILHYSHQTEDAKRQLERFRKIHPNCHFFINYKGLEDDRMKEDTYQVFKAMIEELFK